MGVPRSKKSLYPEVQRKIVHTHTGKHTTDKLIKQNIITIIIYTELLNKYNERIIKTYIQIYIYIYRYIFKIKKRKDEFNYCVRKKKK